MSGIVDEIKGGGVQGILGFDQIDWGGKAGKFYEVWKVDPCCGSPWNIKDALMCMACWYLCGFCSATKLYSTSNGQPCALVPHILCTWFLMPCAAIATRYNLRKKAGVKGNIIGDIVCIWCCSLCACCQELRSVPPSGWNWAVPFTVPVPVAQPPCKVLV